MYEKSSRNYRKNTKKMVPSRPDDFKNMLKLTHVRGAKQYTQKMKRLWVVRGFLSRTKSNLLETLVTNKPKVFLIVFFKNLIYCHCEPSDLSV